MPESRAGVNSMLRPPIGSPIVSAGAFRADTLRTAADCRTFAKKSAPDNPIVAVLAITESRNRIHTEKNLWIRATT